MELIRIRRPPSSKCLHAPCPMKNWARAFTAKTLLKWSSVMSSVLSKDSIPLLLKTMSILPKCRLPAWNNCSISDTLVTSAWILTALAKPVASIAWTTASASSLLWA
ncbi:hypothetical protein BDW62DRAFT_194603 [Aspergillus aurantiobrunneus]